MNHDGGYHLLFSHPRMVADLLTGFIDEPWVEDLDLATLERVNARFHAEGLERRDGDVIWRIKRKSGGDAYVYVALEFQSMVDPWMALRLAVHILLLYLHLVREGMAGAGQLPPVYPVVLFNGESAWTAKRDIADLIAAGPNGAPWPWRPTFRYHVIEERRSETVVRTAPGNVTAVLFELERCRTVGEVATSVERLAALLRDPATASLRRAFVTWLKAVLAPARGIEIGAGDVSELSEIKDMLANRVHEWTEDWYNRGKTEGEAKALIRLLEKRFGPLDENRRQMILKAASPDVGIWFDRAIDASSLEAVFSPSAVN